MKEHCLILTEDKLIRLIERYDGYKQPPLNRDETQLLLFALYNESDVRGGIVAKARASMDEPLGTWEAK